EPRTPGLWQHRRSQRGQGRCGSGRGQGCCERVWGSWRERRSRSRSRSRCCSGWPSRRGCDRCQGRQRRRHRWPQGWQSPRGPGRNRRRRRRADREHAAARGSDRATAVLVGAQGSTRCGAEDALAGHINAAAASTEATTATGAEAHRKGVRAAMTTKQNERTVSSELVPVKFSRLTRRGVLLGLSLSQLITLAIGVLAVVGALYAGGGILLAYTAPIWVLAAALTWIPVARRPAVEWLPVAFWWLWRTTAGQLLYRRRVVTPRPVGTLALPGDVARLREYTDPETNAGMIHDPHQQTLTVICEVSHPAFVLLDPGEQERRVTSWGRVLATACRSGRIATIQVLERTLPDSGTGLAEWWEAHGTADDTRAATTYAELIDRAGPAGERHATTLSLSLDLKNAARQIRTAGGGIRGAAAVLRQEMSTLVAALRSADLTPSGWLTPGQIAVILRGAYDPAIAATLERHGELGQSLATAGPVAVNESWTRLRTDSAHHAVLWISEWPRS